MRLTGVESIGTGAAVRVSWQDGESATFHAVWLRDNAIDEIARHAGSGQRLLSILDLPVGTTIELADIAADGGLKLIFGPDGKSATFPSAWLRERRYDKLRAREAGWVADSIELWDSRLSSEPPTGTFHQVSQDRAVLARWLAAVRRYGFALLSGVPVLPGALTRVVDLFGFVRETNYGRWFDVRATVDPVNLAYTNLGLQAHTDNPYRDPVPTLQLLACLENTVEGGESVVVDGFRAAHRLKQDDPEAFMLLSGYSARFEYAGSNGVRLRAKRPMIELGPDGELLAIRFNNRSSAPTVDVPHELMPAYYAAWRRFAEIIEDPAMAVTFRLSPGDLFMVDNTRVLHARRAFSGAGARWLQGCYADKDGLLSTLAAIEEAEEATAG
jgi:gamma-butyrobetaine dioxygenase